MWTYLVLHILCKDGYCPGSAPLDVLCKGTNGPLNLRTAITLEIVAVHCRQAANTIVRACLKLEAGSPTWRNHLAPRLATSRTSRLVYRLCHVCSCVCLIHGPRLIKLEDSAHSLDRVQQTPAKTRVHQETGAVPTRTRRKQHAETDALVVVYERFQRGAEVDFLLDLAFIRRFSTWSHAPETTSMAEGSRGPLRISLQLF